MRIQVRAAVAAALLVAAAGCATPSPGSVSSSASPAVLVAVPTQSPPAASGTPAPCMAALAEGVLAADDRWGIALEDPATGVIREVIWPFGFVARRDAAGLSLMDAAGAIVARVGDRVSIGGGEIDAAGTWLACPGDITVVASLGASPTTQPSATPGPVAIDAVPLVVDFAMLGELGSFVPQMDTMVTTNGRAVWIDPNGDLVERQLSAAGLEQVRQAVLGTGLFAVDASYGRDPLPGVLPPARGVATWRFQATNAAGTLVTVSMVTIDGDESLYWVTSPERRTLDALGKKLRDPEAWLPTDAWADAAHQVYRAQGWMVLVWSQPGDLPRPGTPDFAAYAWPIADAATFGVSADDPSVQKNGTLRCAVFADAVIAPIAEQLGRDGVLGGTPDQGVSQADLGWAAGNGQVQVTLVKIWPDGSPACSAVGG
jgi:hypothetical protein